MIQLREKLDLLDIEDWIAHQGIEYKKTSGSSGTQLNLRECPRCHGRSWKVYLNAETGLGNCFHGSCVGEPGFNKFSFIRAFLSVTSSEAIQHIERFVADAGWAVKTEKKEEQAPPSDDWVLPQCNHILPGSEPWSYLADRGFGRSEIDHYGWLWCESGKFRYIGHDGQPRLMDFSKRILIPVHDHTGKIATFQGRDITGEAEKRYLFPPGLPGSGRFLYAGHHAIGAQHVIITEGVFDAAATRKALLTRYDLSKIAVVASFGKSLSTGSREHGHDQIGALLALREAGLSRITMLWDGETKTKEDALRVALGLRAFGFETYLAELPSDADPNEVEPSVVIDAIQNAFFVSPIHAAKRRVKWSRQVRL